MGEIKLTREEELAIDEKLGPGFKKSMNEFAKKRISEAKQEET